MANKQIYLILLLHCLSISLLAQPSDMLSLKKNDRTIQTYFRGQQIAFVTTSGAMRDALITGIRNDSIFLQEFLVQQIPTLYGGYITDTAGSFRYAYHYTELSVFKKKTRGFNVARSGGTLFGGGLLLTAGSGIVYLADKEKFSPNLMIAGAAAMGIGFLLQKLTGKPIIIGKNNYTLAYTNLQPQ